MVILGLDPGFASLGWALLDTSGAHQVCLGAGVIRTKPNRKVARCADNVERCTVIFDALRQLHERHRFVFIAAEAQSWTRHANADRSVAMAWGVIAATSEQYNCPVVQVRPQDVKKKLTGSASTSKAVLQNHLQLTVREARAHFSSLAKSHQNHASDALAVAVASLGHDLVKITMRMRGD